MARLDVDITSRLRDFELGVALGLEAETVALVGPSGSGKTTILRCIAGLHRPHAGRIAAGGRPWFDHAQKVDLAPEERSVGMVFQDYALFPHLTVRANVAFGGAERADELLARLGIAHLAEQKPAAISGGERQRVALARALARSPEVLLLDEPLSALDSHTRLTVRRELRDALADAGLPTLLVTHDFREAAALAQRIAVLDEGRILQVGTADELLAAPADATVAMLAGAVVVPGPAAGVGGRDRVAVLPWLVTVSRTPGGIEGVVTSVASEGARTVVHVGELVSEQPSHLVEPLGLRPGDRVWVHVPATAVRVL
jgi:ABC-type sulfate/molybdate transport systems ATPase subunit